MEENYGGWTKEQKEVVVDYVMENWILLYFDKVLISKRKELPSMTASYSDRSYQSGGGFSSSTENVAIKKAEASIWLEKLEQSISFLPELHQKIIRTKYFHRDYTGKYAKDSIIYKKLGIGKTQYYNHKKDALFWLGILLIKNEEV